MKIQRLVVENLYGHVGYDIEFNDNITFLYGDNGCGKTTILNILTYIITGKIYKLFDYRFEKIILSFSHENSNKHQQIILIQTEEGALSIEFMSEQVTIDRRIEYVSASPEERDDINHVYFSKYPILERIQNTFNYIYLPLNRNSSLSLEYPYSYRAKKMAQVRYNHAKNKYGDKVYDPTLYGVEALVTTAFNKSNATLNRINEEFSDDILKSFLDIEDMINTDRIVKYMMSLTAGKIKEIQSEYIQVLKTLNKWDSTSNKKVNSFFDSLEKDIVNSKKGNRNFNIEFLFKLSEVSKIISIIDKARETEKAKKAAKAPIDMFLYTVNQFIHTETNKKEICIDDDGIVFLKTGDGNEIGIQNMSSGEKQIVTFFAYLVFGLRTTNQSIFIVDEPELSLHLNWQRQFVDSIMAINNNVQLIFATHAPEMIGRHRDKAVKLIPKL